jgi:cell shape-determining protein MreC
VKRDPSETFAVVEAKPLAALDRDREVLLIWYQEPPIDVPEPAAPTKSTGRGKRGAQ